MKQKKVNLQPSSFSDIKSVNGLNSYFSNEFVRNGAIKIHI